MSSEPLLSSTPVTYSTASSSSSLHSSSFSSSYNEKIFLIACYTVLIIQYSLVSLLAPFFPSHGLGWGFTLKQVGIVMACDPIGEILASLVNTWILSKFGAKWSALLGMILNAIMSVLFGLSPKLGLSTYILYNVMMMTRLLNGIATTLTFLAIYQLLTTAFPDAIASIGGDMEAWIGLGYMIGPPLGGLAYTLGEHLTWCNINVIIGPFAMPFILFSIFLLVIIVPCVYGSLPSDLDKPTTITVPKGANDSDSHPLLSSSSSSPQAPIVSADPADDSLTCLDELSAMGSLLLRPGGVALNMITMFMGVVFSTAYLPILEPRLSAPPFNLSVIAISWFYVAPALMYMISSVGIGRFLDHEPENLSRYRSMIYVGFILISVGLYLLSSPNQYIVLLAMGMMGVGGATMSCSPVPYMHQVLKTQVLASQTYHHFQSTLLEAESTQASLETTACLKHNTSDTFSTSEQSFHEKVQNNQDQDMNLLRLSNIAMVSYSCGSATMPVVGTTLFDAFGFEEACIYQAIASVAFGLVYVFCVSVIPGCSSHLT